jgi:hypothetical protein
MPTQPQCTFDDATRSQLLDVVALGTIAKFDYFEELVALILQSVARDVWRFTTAAPGLKKSVPATARTSSPR